MKKVALIPLFLLSITLHAQNVGQTGDSIINYTDINGFKQGFWQQKYYSGKIKYEGYFRNDKPVGVFKRYDQRGRLYAKLVFEPDGETAEAELYHENNNPAASGKYVGKIKDGQWRYFTEDSLLIMIESFKMGVKHGLTKTFYLDGQVYQEQYYKDGVLHGENNRYYPNGQMNFRSTYAEGKRVGKFFVYNEEGRVLVFGNYVDDKRHGKWYFYEEDGKPLAEISYHYGIPENQEEWELEQTEKIRELEKNKGTIDDPENFIHNPELYLFNKERNDIK